MKKQFRAECIGVDLTPRAEDIDNHAMVTILIEDDEFWGEKLTISSHWLDEIIQQLTIARQFLDTMPDDPSGCGKLIR